MKKKILVWNTKDSLPHSLVHTLTHTTHWKNYSKSSYPSKGLEEFSGNVYIYNMQT